MEGYTVESADSAETAMEHMRLEQPDLLLLDIMLPGIDGYELCSRMQSDPKLSQVPVIMLTARTMNEDMADGYETGADDYITKPFDIDELLIRIRAQLHHLYHEHVSDLTGLPGSHAVEQELRRRLAEPGQWRVLDVDIANLRVYNEAYSFSEGDELIRLASDVLRSALQRCDPNGFVGHVSGGNFVALVSEPAAACVESAARDRFREAAQRYFSATDRSRGYMVALDRDGQAKQWALPGLRVDSAELPVSGPAGR